MAATTNTRRARPDAAVRRARAPDPARASKMRLAAIRAIQAMRRQLDLAEDVYRNLVESSSAPHGCAVRSAGACNQAQLDAVAAKLRQLLGQPASGWKNKPKDQSLMVQALMRKIEAQLADQGREWDYGHALAQRICKVDRLEFCTPADLHKVIAALDYDAKRHPERSRTGHHSLEPSK
jgi:phage gp16-like protein